MKGTAITMNINKTEISVVKNPFLNESYTKISHKSGLDIYVVTKDFSMYYALFGTKYGSYDNVFRLEGESEYTEVPAGIAHFLEHKMFESEDGKDVFELYAQTGADANAYTSTDRTAYLFSCTEEFYPSFEILLEMVTKSHFTKETVEKEQGIIGEEIRMCKDRPNDAVYYGLCEAMYESNPVRIPIAGTEQSIALITPELLYKCYDTFYQMSNMALCICGKVNVEKIIEIADRMLLQKPQRAIEYKDYKDPPKVYRPRSVSYMDVSKPIFRIGVKNVSDAPEELGDLLCEVLFNKSESFYSELYENGLLISYYSYFQSSRSASYMTIGGDSDDPEKVYEKFLEYTKNIVENGISDESFIRAKRVLYAQALEVFDSSENITEEMLESVFRGTDFLDYAGLIDAITKTQVEKFARELFDESKYAMSVVYPKEMRPEEKV